MGNLHFGIARRIITPKIGGNLMGYSPDVISTKVNDDLTATAVYFMDGELDALLVSVTVCVVQQELTDRVFEIIEKKCAVPRERCLLHATHTHSGPCITDIVGWGNPDSEYIESIFIPCVVDAAVEAVESAKEVRMKVSSGQSLAACNRRVLREDNRIGLGQNPWGPFNPDMTVISFCDKNDKLMANIVHYGAHCTAAGINTEITRDWAGVVIDTLEEITGATTVFLASAAGDVGPRLANGETAAEGRSVRYALEIGAVAALDAVQIFRKRDAFENVGLCVRTGTLMLPLDKRIALEAARAELQRYTKERINLAAKKRAYYECVIKSYEDGYEDVEFLPVRQTLISVGGVTIVPFPYEPFSEIGMRIAAANPSSRTLVIGTTNDYMGYFVTEDQICRGGYEVDYFLTSQIQPYAKDADYHLIKETLKNLRAMKGED